MVPQPTEQEAIDAGERMKVFVSDPAVQAAIARMASRNYDEFKKATTDDEIRAAHARGVVLDQFVSELQVVVDQGHVQTILRKERELREERSKPRQSRVKTD